MLVEIVSKSHGFTKLAKLFKLLHDVHQQNDARHIFINCVVIDVSGKRQVNCHFGKMPSKGHTVITRSWSWKKGSGGGSNPAS